MLDGHRPSDRHRLHWPQPLASTGLPLPLSALSRCRISRSRRMWRTSTSTTTTAPATVRTTSHHPSRRPLHSSSEVGRRCGRSRPSLFRRTAHSATRSCDHEPARSSDDSRNSSIHIRMLLRPLDSGTVGPAVMAIRRHHRPHRSPTAARILRWHRCSISRRTALPRCTPD